MLSLQQVFFRYDGEDEPVVADLDAAFYPGEIHVVAGPSGCGKSTLFQIINGVIPHVNEGEFRGSILYRGTEISGKNPKERCRTIGLVMQDPDSQFCTFTVEDELAFGLENLCMEQEEIRARIEEILPLIHLEGREKDNLSFLSGGQKQKVAIASLLIMEPEILILDEPTANLDPKSRREILDLIVRVAKEKNMTVILTEHHLEDIFPCIDRCLIMGDSGRVLLQGRIREVLESLKGQEFDGIRCSLPPSLWKTKKHEPRKNTEQKEMKSEEIVALRDVSFAYPLADSGRKRKKGAPVLEGLDLTVHRGDFLVIAGENGAGKTTLIKLIFRVVKPDRGSVVLFGEENERRVRKQIYRKMGLVFQNPETQFLTNQVDEEMLFSLRKADMTREEKEEKVTGMLDRFSLLSYAKKSPFALSQGQKRRLSVATMLLTDQDLLFLDEPTYGQDYQNRQELMAYMEALNEKGVTIVMITHDEDLIAEFARRVVFIQNGAVAFDGTPGEYFEYRGEKKL